MATRKFLVNVDLTQNELMNTAVHKLASAPASPVEGQIYYDTTNKIVYFYDGTGWQSMKSGSGSTPFGNITTGTNTGATMTVGTGATITYTGSGVVNANQFKGNSTVAVADGGTGATSHTPGAVLLGNGTSAITSLPVTTAGAIIIGDGAGAPTTLNAFTGASGVLKVNYGGLGFDASTVGANDFVVGTGLGSLGLKSGSAARDAIGLGTGDSPQFTSLTLSGNLLVQGTATFQGGTVTVQSEVVTIDDNIIVLNSNVTGAPTENAGIEIERGTSANSTLLWNETDDNWEVSNGTNTHKIARRYATNVGDGTAVSFTVTHNLGTRDVTVQVYDNATFEAVDVYVARATANTVTVTFNSIPAANAYRVVVVG